MGKFKRQIISFIDGKYCDESHNPMNDKGYAVQKTNHSDGQSMGVFFLS
jgi:hypothetical protein